MKSTKHDSAENSSSDTHEKEIQDLKTQIESLRKDLDWATIGWNIEILKSSNCWEIMQEIRKKHKL